MLRTQQFSGFVRNEIENQKAREATTKNIQAHKFTILLIGNGFFVSVIL